MDASHQELLDKYKCIKEALKKEKPKRLKGLEQNVYESKAVNIRLAGDLEAKEEEIMSLNELLRQEQLKNVTHEKTIMKQNWEINALKSTLLELLESKGKYR